MKLRKKDYIISQAKLFDPRINTIELLSDGLYVGFDGVDLLLLYLVCALIVLCIVYVLFMKKYYHLHEEYLKGPKK